MSKTLYFISFSMLSCQSKHAALNENTNKYDNHLVLCYSLHIMSIYFIHLDITAVSENPSKVFVIFFFHLKVPVLFLQPNVIMMELLSFVSIITIISSLESPSKQRLCSESQQPRTETALDLSFPSCLFVKTAISSWQGRETAPTVFRKKEKRKWKIVQI